MKGKILLLANHFIIVYAFRREMVIRLLELGYEVVIALPVTDEAEYFRKLGCKLIDTPIDRRKANPFTDIKLLINYMRIMRGENPDVVLTYTIKPNIYGGLAAKFTRVKAIHSVTGLGSVYIQELWHKKIVVTLNRIAFKKTDVVFFQNEHNRELYYDLNILKTDHRTVMVAGSGVNLNSFPYSLARNDKKIVFTFVGRILKDKGIEEYLDAAEQIKSNYPDVIFQVVGFVEEEKYVELLNFYTNNGIVSYLGKRDDIGDIMRQSSCIVLPSYGEGRGTVLQEGASIGRPLITCDTYGCRDNVEDGKNGYLCKVADSDSLIFAMEKFLSLSADEKIKMGRYSREKAEKEFDRSVITETYIQEIEKKIHREI